MKLNKTRSGLRIIPDRAEYRLHGGNQLQVNELYAQFIQTRE